MLNLPPENKPWNVVRHSKTHLVKITIEETAENVSTTEYLQATFNLKQNVENIKPYMKVRQTDKILHLYSGNLISSTK